MSILHRSFLFILMVCATPAMALSPAQEAQMRAADIVILGEIHDNADHHKGQAALMAQLSPKAVVFEMLSPEQAAIVNGKARRDLDTLAEKIEWDASGWPAFALYQPVFAALGEADVSGAASPRGTVRAAFTQGAAAVFGPGAEAFGLDQALPPDQLERREKLQFDAHCAAMPLEMMGGMVEAQRFRDARFAQVALEALKTHGAPVVVIAGNGHARRDWGMPAMIARAAPEVTTFAVGFVEAPHAGKDPRFDATLVHSAPQRGDPCGAFK